MADYIEKKDAYKAIEECWEGSCGEYDASVIIHDTIEALDSIPSTDVQPVVRCKDCEYYRENKHGYCSFFDEKFMPFDGYCSNGVRMDGISNAK